jgi:hypothetical protein
MGEPGRGLFFGAGPFTGSLRNSRSPRQGNHGDDQSGNPYERAVDLLWLVLSPRCVDWRQPRNPHKTLPVILPLYLGTLRVSLTGQQKKSKNFMVH